MEPLFCETERPASETHPGAGRLIISWRDGPEASMAYLIPNPPRETRHATHAGLLLDNSAASLDAIFGRDTFRSHREKPHHWFLVQHV